MKKKTFVCIFAHPDDEAFGPSGFIHKLTKIYDVYILCATRGQAGQDSDKAKKSLGHRRADELKQSAKLLGVKRVYFLGFRDGILSNNLYHKLAAKIQTHLEKLRPLEIMTFGLNGISGHIDHITVSYVTTYVFHKLSFIKILYYTVLTEERAAAFRSEEYFIYFPDGYKRREIDKIVSVRDVWDKKLAAMKCHMSQKHDYERILRLTQNLPKEEYFMVVEK